jgi:hypothetical protein
MDDPADSAALTKRGGERVDASSVGVSAAGGKERISSWRVHKKGDFK